MRLVPKAILLSKAVWLTAYPHGPSETEYMVTGAEERLAMEALLDGARVEWSASGRDGGDVDKLFEDLSEGYKTLQASAGVDNLPASLKAIGPNITKLMSIASSELARADHAWEVLQRAEKDLNEAGHVGYVVFFGRPDGRVISELPEIHHTYFRLHRLFLYSLDDQNEICADLMEEAQKGHTEYVEVEVDFGSFSTWMMATGRWQDVEDIQTVSLSPTGAKSTTPDAPKIPTVTQAKLNEWAVESIDRYLSEHNKLPTQDETWHEATRAFQGKHVPRQRVRAAHEKAVARWDPRYHKQGPHPKLEPGSD